ncbi:transcriptional regulator [Salmonella enterica subsp. enterica serovar Java]|uniref:Transcriptional regulator n=1 Tax=Salmonella enterica subsp. enterica serovar Java TaxID=224729 RepID=A0A3Y9C4D9_SALEB|nr:transcriptional regulator [Salmonella enterica subsp. enterica serovar Java]ECG3199717.1 transcriptional regulator [Salmonella enterica subsp. enterica serovar Java]EDC4055920.1 transcriptional regulator [Salmonella enterica subsp. enterica serovar Java]HCA3587743.1 transcriptional regulator [Salmonella enterica subsp. enterica serovar Java]
MTGCNRMPARQVIIHGDCWPVVSAVQYVVRAMHPAYRCEVTGSLPCLLQRLAGAPEAILILCLRPREHIYLFYALKSLLLDHPALVISDKLLFSDRVILHSWGDIPCAPYCEIQTIISGLQKYGHCPYPLKGTFAKFLSVPECATGFFEVPVIFNNPKRLMRYMSLLMLRATTNCGVTSSQQKLLWALYKGHYSLSGLTKILSKNEKQIWQTKGLILTKLGMRNRQYDLLYGTRFCPEIQRTAFTSPAEVKKLCGADVPAEYENICSPSDARMQR